MDGLTQPLSEGKLANLSKRLNEVEESVRQDGPAFWGAQCALPFEQTVVASLIREMEVLMLFLAAQHLLIRDMREAQRRPVTQVH
jgi:hypothetical protein